MKRAKNDCNGTILEVLRTICYGSFRLNIPINTVRWYHLARVKAGAYHQDVRRTNTF